jgi:hypothetical protein
MLKKLDLSCESLLLYELHELLSTIRLHSDYTQPEFIWKWL